MTGTAAVLLVVAGLFAVGDWVARLGRNTRLEYLCKPGTLVALIGTAVVLSPAPGAATRRDWFVAALVLSLVGDVCLMLPTDLFMAGLAAFLVGHLCYLAGFWVRPPGAVALALSAGIVVVAVVPWAARILSALGAEPRSRPPVALYMVVIAAMLATALATGNPFAGVGAALFVSSDTMIAWNRFVWPFRCADVGIMVTYHLGQAALVLSLLR